MQGVAAASHRHVKHEMDKFLCLARIALQQAFRTHTVTSRLRRVGLIDHFNRHGTYLRIPDGLDINLGSASFDVQFR
jgi:hypothetical protein